jgi:3-oxoadipate enol-lactonase
MHVTTRGTAEAPTLVLLHGGIGAGAYHWGKQADALADRFCIHMPDLPGHGRTPLDNRDNYSSELLVETVIDYLGALDPPVHLGGFSMGGHTALRLVAIRPELVASLVLVGVSLRDHPGLDGWRQQFHPDQLAREYPFWAKQLSRLHAPLGGPDAWRDVCLRDSKQAGIQVDHAKLTALDAPVLLLRGDRDSTVDPAQYAEMRELFDRSDEAVVPAGGHDIQITRSELVKPVLRDFYERVAKG